MKLLTGLRLPVQQRVFVPDAHGSEDYNPRAQVVSEVHCEEAGPDTVVRIKLRGEGYHCGTLRAPAADAEALVARLLRDVPAADREVFQIKMDELEDAIVRQDAHARTMARRWLMAILDTMAADLAIASGGR